MSKQSKLKQQKYTAFIGIFAGCWFLGLLLWGSIKLPYSNPWNITGILTQIQYNPNNDLARLIVMLMLPLVALTVAYVICALFKRPLFEPANRTLAPFEGRRRIAVTVCLLVLTLGMQMGFQTYHANGGLDTFHEGESLGPGVGYEQGQVPYRDAVFVHGIIQDPVRSVVAWRLFGRSIASVRLLESLICTAALLLMALAVLYLFRFQPLPSFMLMAWILFNASGVVRSEPLLSMPLTLPARDIMTYGFLLVTAVLGLYISQNTQKSAWRYGIVFFLFTFLPLFTFAYSVDRAFYLSAAWAVALPVLYIGWIHTSAHKKIFWMATALGAIAAFLGFGFLCRWAFVDFFDFVFVKMPQYKELMDGMIFDPFKPVNAFILAQAAFHLYWLLSRFLQCLHGEKQRPILALRVFVKQYFAEMTLALFATFFMRSAMGRSDWEHMSYSYIPTVILSGVILLKYYVMPWMLRLEISQKTKRILLAAGLALAVLLGASRGWNAVDSGKAAQRYPVAVEDADLIPQTYTDVVDYIQTHMQADETFMTMTSEGFFYYLANQACPIRFPVVWFAMPTFYQEQIVTQLETGTCKYVIMNSPHWANAIDGFGNRDRLPVLWGYLTVNYAYDTQIAGHEIWVRK